MIILDPGVNFGFAFVSGTYDAFATTIHLEAGQGLFLKDPAVFGEYNASWLKYPPELNIQDDTTREIVRIVSLAGDTVTVIRGQEGIAATPKNTTGTQYVLIVSPTAKTLDDNNVFLSNLQTEQNLHSTQIATLQQQIFSSGSVHRLEKNYSYLDFSSGSVLIGLIDNYVRIEKCANIVLEGFDSGTLTVGDIIAHGTLMVAADSNLGIAGDYHTEPDYLYNSATNLYIFFETGAPTKGSGSILIYYG